MSASTTTRGLTVAQLKALCKDLGLKNYSKLGKAALLEKIQAARAASAPEPTLRAQERLGEDVDVQESQLAAGLEAGAASAGAGAEAGGQGSSSTGRAAAAGTTSTLASASGTAHSAAPGPAEPATRKQDTLPPRPRSPRKGVHSDLGLGATTGGTTDVSAGAPSTTRAAVSSTSTLLSSSTTPHSTFGPRTPEEDTLGSLARARPPPDIGLGPGGRPTSALSSSPSASASTLAPSPSPNASSSTYVSAFTTFSAVAPSSPTAHHDASSSTLASSPPSKKRTASTAGLDRDAIVKVARTHAARASRDRFKVPPVPTRPATGLVTFTRASPAFVPTPPPISVSVGSSSRQPLATTSFEVLRPRNLPLASSRSPTPTLADNIALKSNSTSSLVVHPSISQPRRRFQPLRPTVTVVPSVNTLIPPPLSVPLDAALEVQLDFTILPSVAVPAPRLITLPMSLRQRGRARNWAIILMRLTDRERKQCVLVCKAMRYGVYLSAAQILRTDFPGARLTSVIRGVALDVKDMWPYLRLRRAEVASRRTAYDKSFLPSFYARFGIGEPIASALWTSPDHEDQLTVAIRFLIAKAWFAISLGGSDARIREWLQGTVIDTQEVTPRNVWTITQQQQRENDTETETLYVVYETCEVVGKSNSRSAGDIPLRNDWATHIANGTLTKKPLLEYIVWHNGEDYNRGISTAWLRRVAEEGDLGRVKRRIAERYVLACVAANSVSGTYKTARQMADEFAGVSELGTPNMPNKASHTQSISLYLPEHHYVESVCFITLGRKALHPALAAVQTPAREYIVLRDTGMHVGCEEDGLAEAWMDVLGCDTHGAAV